jgi:hypothetical protein
MKMFKMIDCKYEIANQTQKIYSSLDIIPYIDLNSIDRKICFDISIMRNNIECKIYIPIEYKKNFNKCFKYKKIYNNFKATKIKTEPIIISDLKYHTILVSIFGQIKS